MPFGEFFIANYPDDTEMPNCATGICADKVVFNIASSGKNGRVSEAPMEPVNKLPNYCN
jgi:hypothetical protein